MGDDVRIYFAPLLRMRRRHLCRMMAATLYGMGLSACALSVPMAGMGTDDTPTGSIRDMAPTAFSAEMDSEDWRRAKSALDTALDPQGNGARVAWDNPQSGLKGSFVPIAQAVPRDDKICRAFSAEVVKDGNARTLRSSACRKNGGEWVLGPIRPARRDVGALPKKDDNLAERDTGTQLN